MEANIRLESFDEARDLPRLKEWLAKPHIARWWPDIDLQVQEARERPEGAGHVLIYLDDTPVGYMRWQHADASVLEEVGLCGIPDGSVDMDILIGEPNLVGKRIGRRAIQMLRDRILNDSTVPLVGMVTSVANTNAIRAIEAAGFSPFQEYVDPRYGRCLVLTCGRPMADVDVNRAAGDAAQPGVEPDGPSARGLTP